MVRFQKQSRRKIWPNVLQCGMRPVTAIMWSALVSVVGLVALQASIVGDGASWLGDLHVPTSAPVSEQQQLLPRKRTEIPQSSTDASAAAAAAAAVTAIPHRLLFLYDPSHDGLQEAAKKELLNVNIENTINLYGKAFSEDSVSVTYLNNTTCQVEIMMAKPSFLQYYNGEEHKQMKNDICRYAALYNRGGYIIDPEVRVIEPLVLDTSVRFATISSPNARTFMQAWLAASANHAVLGKALDIMLDYYEGKATDPLLQKGGKNLGRRSLKAAFDEVNPSETGDTYFLTELNLKRSPTYPDLPRQLGKGCCCNFVAHDNAAKKVYLFSRIPGVTPYCDTHADDRNAVRKSFTAEQSPNALIKPGRILRLNQTTAAKQDASAKQNIPLRLIFTYKTKLLDTKEPKVFYDNVRDTIERFRALWGEDSMEVLFLDNRECADEIEKADKRLLPHFQNEPEGKFKGDVCRIAALYNTGGYYLDVDLKVIEAPAFSDETVFSTVRSPKDTNFFQAFLASMPGHIVLREALDVMLAYYEGRYELRGKNMGCSALKAACDNVGEDKIGPVRWFRELNLDSSPSEYPDVPRQQGQGCCCNYIVHDENERKAYFYSRIVGAGPYCEVSGTG
mmetsp:Transcript_14214/g.30846  ORF Transcript_14214/g.30846 Transcript_14214/m.30846 type:complete len:620 (-) Transcript_14214:399-2258(-)